MAPDPATVVRQETRLVARLLTGAGLATLVAVPFLAVLLLVRSGWAPLERVDRGVADELNGWALRRPTAVAVLELLESVLSPWVFRLAVVVAAIGLWQVGSRRLATWAVTTMAVGGALGVGLKALVERARPTFADPVSAAGSYSFPSGHALNSFLGVAVLLLIAVPMLSRRGRWLAWAGAGALVLLTGFDRLALGVHFTSDVVAGWFVALAVVVGTTTSFGAWRHGPSPVTEGVDPAGSRGMSGSPPDAASVEGRRHG